MYRTLILGGLVGALTILGTAGTAEAGHRGHGCGYSIGSNAAPIPRARCYRYPTYRSYYSSPYVGRYNYYHPSFGIGVGFGHYGGGHYGGGHHGGHH